MKLRMSAEWLRRAAEEEPDDLPGILAVSPEIYEQMKADMEKELSSRDTNNSANPSSKHS